MKLLSKKDSTQMEQREDESIERFMNRISRDLNGASREDNSKRYRSEGVVQDYSFKRPPNRKTGSTYK